MNDWFRIDELIKYLTRVFNGTELTSESKNIKNEKVEEAGIIFIKRVFCVVKKNHKYPYLSEKCSFLEGN